ncbi:MULTISPECIES: DUF3551 domain-containing protein [Rhodopseudomonas]|uniref:DUF3551 domain-containing protein n=1 Tax=Rhodopseudomonas palustris TaxID=1076 RepID=A0A0D7E7B3_RHOPL|nr:MULTISPECIES: DUF3551 domain-containing protein [Rhodopseudomonas]KIZ36683.1 hypothetical protein OO17_24410 [Rhodopseudomonas palustris]MDF3808825.1 DUF3551 domain-containing protein [Rhodopseudomonas sp. BAL398]WOK19143.1 DUF3551 domain-containing protein [Rhodopseudomonas sp. BAL398]
MRAALFALLALGAVSALDTTPAEARDYPFCIKGQNYDQTLGDCSFMTYAQCQATASGRLAYCDANPYFEAYVEPAPRIRHQRRHRRD